MRITVVDKQMLQVREVIEIPGQSFAGDDVADWLAREYSSREYRWFITEDGEQPFRFPHDHAGSPVRP